MNWNEIRVQAADVAIEAGTLLRHGLQAPKTLDRKTSAVDLVTEYDRAAEKLILERLRDAYPDHHLISEEDGQNGMSAGLVDSPYFWYVDPLDGTNNFAHGLPAFSVSLALYEDGRPRVAVVYDPMRDELFSAVAGGGAELGNGRERSAVQVSRNASLVESLLGTGFPYDRHHSEVDNILQLSAFLKQAQGLRRAGSAALDLAYVAAGRLDGFWELKLNSWDVAAGVLLVTEAGGRVSGVGGQPFRIQPQVSLVASNGLIHDAMIGVLLTSGRLDT